MNTTTIPLELHDLWRANTDDHTIYVAAETRAEAHGAMRLVIQAMYKPDDDTTLDESYYNLSSASEMIEEGVSDDLAHRLFESGRFGESLLYVDAPIMVVPNPGRLMQVWLETRQADRETRKHMADYQPGRATLRASRASAAK